MAFYSKKYISEAVLIHRAVPESSYRFYCQYTDKGPEKDIDHYYLRAAQKNGQWAWVTPVRIAS